MRKWPKVLRVNNIQFFLMFYDFKTLKLSMVLTSNLFFRASVFLPVKNYVIFAFIFYVICVYVFAFIFHLYLL